MSKSRVRFSGVSMLAGLVSILGTTCTVFDPKDRQPPLQAPTPIQGAIDFDIRESYATISDPGMPRIQLSMRTQQSYPCSNWSLISSVESGPGAIAVQLGGIDKPEICLTSIGPATSESFLNLANGRYGLEFTSRGNIDRFTLTVTDAALEVTGMGSVLHPRHARIWRYPHNSLVYLCGTTTETTSMCDECLNRIRDAAGLQEYHFGPDGFIPYPTETFGYWANTAVRYFTYADDAAFERARDALIAYSRDVIGTQDGIGIVLQNWRNEPVYSWMYDRVP